MCTDHPSHSDYVWLTAHGSHGLDTVLKNKSLWKCEWSWLSNTSDIFQSLLSHSKKNTHSQIKCRSSAACTQNNTISKFMVLFSYKKDKKNSRNNNLNINGNCGEKKGGFYKKKKTAQAQSSLMTSIIHDLVSTYRQDINFSNSGSLAAELIADWTG